jgi:molybdopterin-guanine dinucleotide biosynthesis protein A
MANAALALIVNAGGQSRRMGSNKALLTMPDGEPLVAHIVQRLHPLASAGIIVVANAPAVEAALPQALGVHLVGDRWPGCGALGGLASGLAECRGWAMAVACDMPFLDPALFRHLAALAFAQDNTWDAVVPLQDGRAQVFHALYHARCLPALVTCLRHGQLAVRETLDTLRVRWVDEAELAPLGDVAASFLNVNTPAEWAAAMRRFA